MNFPTATLPNRPQVRIPDVVGDGSSPGSLSDSQLREALERAFERRHQVDAELATLAGEVVHRSRPSLGAEGLAVRSGNGTAAVFVADVGLITRAEARRLCDVGSAATERVSLTGERLPAEFPAVAEAMGVLPVDSANFIVAALEQAAPRADVRQLRVAEQRLVEFALCNPADEVRKVALRWQDALDEDGVEPREDELVERRTLLRTTLANGMRRYRLELDPLSAAYVDAAIDARVGAVLRAPRFVSTDGRDDGTDLPDPRALPQIAADAIVQLARHSNSCPHDAVPTPAATIVVRMTLQSLLSGLGEAHIDGIDQAISATTARRLAADANIIPMVLGGYGEVLDMGRSRRLFTHAQRLAFAERDGGCAWANCHRPPSHTEAHHIRWWHHGGETNLDNGVLLCSMHHHRVHRDGWRVQVDDNVPWFIPPPHLDRQQTPRRGGRPPDLERLAG
ncbi:DUF222 domain-containing protein [Glaciihabitans sp. UYNi722]|uniref:HNH endonuclease signature motif containing protein n=1 Tax=Glaciihabitans sp. UYNi722 TaxID=3156344 RepID=UPI0033916986